MQTVLRHSSPISIRSLHAWKETTSSLSSNGSGSLTYSIQLPMNKPSLLKHLEPTASCSPGASDPYPISAAEATFDPTKASPPNPFIDQLKERMRVYYESLESAK